MNASETKPASRNVERNVAGQVLTVFVEFLGIVFRLVVVWG